MEHKVVNVSMLTDMVEIGTVKVVGVGVRKSIRDAKDQEANFNFEKKKLDMKLNESYLFYNSGLVDTCSHITDFYENVRPNTVQGEMSAIPISRMTVRSPPFRFKIIGSIGLAFKNK